ncbi:MAG: M12 family metallo-peptidase [Acidimicrobiia bacterium]
MPGRLPVTYLLSLVALPVVWLIVAFPVFDMVSGTDGTGGSMALECGRRVTNDADDGVSVISSVRVIVSWDEEWSSLHGADAEARARRVVLDAGSLFRGVGIHLLPVGTTPWESPDGAASISALMKAAHQAVPLDGADIVAVLSGQEPKTTEDGFAEVGGRFVIVAHHPERPGRDAQVLAHEMSHLFGAHHGCDVPGYEGLMAEVGFEEPDIICPCTRRILEMNARRFHEPSG